MEPDEGGVFEPTEGHFVHDEIGQAPLADERSDSNEKSSGWADVCRLCAKTNDHVIPIFEAEGAQHDLSDKIHKYLPIRVAETDTLPIQLCYHCAATILAWHELLEGCLDAQRQLAEMHSERTSKEQIRSKDDQDSSEEVEDPEPRCTDKEDSGAIQPGEMEQSGEDSKPRSRKSGKKLEENVSVAAARKKRKSARVLGTINLAGTEEKSRSVLSRPPTGRSRNAKRRKNTPEDTEILAIVEGPSEDKSHEEEITCKTSSRKKFNDVDPYVCDFCGKQFLLRGSLMSHLRLHTGLKYFTCHICGKQFAQNGCLYYHLKHVHGGVKDHSCDICGRSFAMKATMEDHRRSIHTGERPYVCDSCGKTFTTKSSLYIHSRIHTENYPYECKYCKKSFRWNQQLIGHLTIHTGERNHTCDLCGKAFGVKNQLTRHKRTHNTDKPYTCEKCGMRFGQKRYLTSHERFKHG